MNFQQRNKQMLDADKEGYLRSETSLIQIFGRAARNVGQDYVISWKPNPDIFVRGSWNPEEVRVDFAENLKKLKGCIVEVIMKDVSSVEYKPQHLWEWADIAVEEAQRTE